MLKTNMSACSYLMIFLFFYAAVVGSADAYAQDIKRIGVIGLDTSHSIAFTKLFNENPDDEELAGFRVVAAYPYGSRNIESSTRRIPGYIEDIKLLGVEIVDSIEELLERVDVVLLETNDGHPHLEQALKVFQAGKPVFIDKPIAASLVDAVKIFEAAARFQVPVFSSSSLRFMKHAQEIRNGAIGNVLGAESYSPAELEPTHPDLFWYGVHGVETLFTLMGTGCQEVQRISTPDTDIVIGLWEGGRIGTFRGTRSGSSGYGGRAFGEEGIMDAGPYEGYRPLVVEIARFFRTGVAPVEAAETLEIFAFMAAADESKRQGGSRVNVQQILQQAKESASRSGK